MQRIVWFGDSQLFYQSLSTNRSLIIVADKLIGNFIIRREIIKEENTWDLCQNVGSHNYFKNPFKKTPFQIFPLKVFASISEKFYFFHNFSPQSANPDT